MASEDNASGNGTPAFDLTTASLMIGRVSLRVRDLDRLSRYYQEIIGLERLQATANSVILGADGADLLELVGDPGLAPRDPRAAGLFHTAFLLPRRADLARWLAYAMRNEISLVGASDHTVSEALYLSDPEGNGIEIYADRPPSTWTYAGGEVEMATDPLDVEGLLRAGGEGEWAGAPKGTVVGHVHLQVGALSAAERFYRDLLGFELTCRYRGGSFFGAGGYHHQLAANVWNSQGAGVRPDGLAGLAGFEVAAEARELNQIRDRAAAAEVPLLETENAFTLSDPWGIPITIVAK